MSDLFRNPEARFSRVEAHIVKLGCTGVHLDFLPLFQNRDCGYSLELPQQDGSNVYSQSMF